MDAVTLFAIIVFSTSNIQVQPMQVFYEDSFQSSAVNRCYGAKLRLETLNPPKPNQPKIFFSCKRMFKKVGI